MPEPVLRTLHPSPAQQDLFSQSQQFAQVLRRLRHLEAVNAALSGQLEQLSKAQAGLADQVRQLQADNEALRSAGAPPQKAAQPSEWPVLAHFGYCSSLFNFAIRDRVRTITFLPSLSGAPEDAHDVSLKQDRSVLAWSRPNPSHRFSDDLFIAGEGGVTANPDSSCLFYNCEYLEEIDFGHCFDTSKVTNMANMFSGCRWLKTLDLSGFDTSAVTDMHDMFRDCSGLTNKTCEILRAQGFPVSTFD